LRKQAVVDQTSGGVKFLMDKNKITVLEGLGSFVDATHVAVAKADGTSETIEAKTSLLLQVQNHLLYLLSKSIKRESSLLPKLLKSSKTFGIGGGVVRNRIRSSIFTIGSASFCCRIFRQFIPGMDASLSKE
jgi:dihydrolipoamide dehydrogenase